MREIRRGQIWRIKFGREKLGSEFGADEPEGVRPGLIVSRDIFNKSNGRLTVVPLTVYDPWRARRRFLWGMTIKPLPYNKYASDLDIKLATILLEKSVIDCGYLWTLSEHDVLTRYYGKLTEQTTDWSDAVLQAVIGGGVRYNRVKMLKFHEGDVVIMNLPGMSKQRCLVVSSPAVDALREQIMVEVVKREPKRPLGHCTVVPLVSLENFKSPRGVAKVNVYPLDGQGSPIAELAVCQEIYTIDWRSRGLGKTVGRVYDRYVEDVEDYDMEDVRQALRDYLALPL
jgi:mRNA-degrading endonuclease toxin of MazEF toxin-antitoxin module